MSMVDRDGRPIEPTGGSSEPETFPVPEDLDGDARVAMKKPHLAGEGSTTDRPYHRPDGRGAPACIDRTSPESWRVRPGHGIVGNHPACPDCFDVSGGDGA